MATLADIRKSDDDNTVVISTNHSSPPGHFVVTATVHGILTIYVLKGASADENALVMGRVEAPPPSDPTSGFSVYKGSGLRGGLYLGNSRHRSSRFTSYGVAFAEIVSGR